MTNRIAHGYFYIDLEVVWQTVKKASPELLAKLPEAQSFAAAYAPARQLLVANSASLSYQQGAKHYD